ncbi:MAG: P-loop NTPase [Terracidiphilus sp.]|jgi:CO dehydrogenase maturation factor
MKLAVSGKGGVGKSTVAGTLARLYAAQGRQVLAVDADPDANLASAIGMPPELQAKIRTISTERHLIEERTGAKVQGYGQIFKINPEVADIAARYATRHAGVDLLTLGAVQRAAGGCACPESVLLKNLVQHLVLKRDEIVILDMEAGIEHLGRGTAMGVNLMLVVVEPGKRSVETAHRVREMASAIGIGRFGVVLNKSITSDSECRWISDEFGAETLLGVIPFDNRIGLADRLGQSLMELGHEDILSPFRTLADVLISRTKEKTQ